MVVYIPFRKLFSTLVGTFDLDTLLPYIDRVITGKTTLFNLDPDSLKLNEVNCSAIKEEVQENIEEDEILREIIEEERKKREAFEKEREEMKKEKKKKKGNKKKDL